MKNVETWSLGKAKANVRNFGVFSVLREALACGQLKIEILFREEIKGPDAVWY